MAKQDGVLRWITVFNGYPRVHDRYEAALGDLVDRWNHKYAAEGDAEFPALVVEGHEHFPYWRIARPDTPADDFGLDVGELCDWFRAQFDQASLEEDWIPISHTEALTAELAHWYRDHGLDPRSADEWTVDELEPHEWEYIMAFCNRWEDARAVEDYNAEHGK